MILDFILCCFVCGFCVDLCLLACWCGVCLVATLLICCAIVFACFRWFLIGLGFVFVWVYLFCFVFGFGVLILFCCFIDCCWRFVLTLL